MYFTFRLLVHLWYLADLFAENEIFQTKVLDEPKSYIYIK